MIINKAYKTELQVNNKLATYFEGCAGYARFVYNWALDYWIKEYDHGDKRTGWMKLNTELTKLKETEYKWMYDYPNNIRDYAIRNCDQAYQNFLGA
jgi:putative transposase